MKGKAVKRKIIEIDEGRCNGCGRCIPNCPEGALQIIDGKARLVSDLFCDGLGACIGHCPEGAIKIVEREAEPYSERKVMERIVMQGQNVTKAHLLHLKEHGEEGCLKEAISFLEEKGIEGLLAKKSGNKKIVLPTTSLLINNSLPVIKIVLPFSSTITKVFITPFSAVFEIKRLRPLILASWPS